MSKDLWMIKGLPGSGKSTKAKEIVQNNKNTFRVNKDEIRNMFYFKYYDPRHEKLVALTNDSLIETLLKAGHNVVCDNCNLDSRAANYFTRTSVELGARLHVIEMAVSPEECIKRDALRKAAGERCVGRDVILNMAHRYGLIKQVKSLAIFDMDGTLSNLSKRVHYVRNMSNDPNWKPRWDKFFDEVGNDECRFEVREKLYEHALQGHEIVICSGRPEKTRKATEQWLRSFSINPSRLIMRQDYDNQDDVTLKQGFLDHLLDKSKVIAVHDDRKKVVDMWKRNGLNVIDWGGPDSDF